MYLTDVMLFVNPWLDAVTARKMPELTVELTIAMKSDDAEEAEEVVENVEKPKKKTKDQDSMKEKGVHYYCCCCSI